MKTEYLPIFNDLGEIVRFVGRPLQNGHARADVTTTWSPKGPSGASFTSAWMNWFNGTWVKQDDKITFPYLQHGWFFSAVTAKANALASVPFRMFEGEWKSNRLAPAKNYDRFEKLFDKPNSELTGKQFWQLHSKNRDIFGEALWVFLDANKKPTEFANAKEVYHLMPAHWEPIIDEKSDEIKGWKMCNKPAVTIEARFVYQFKEPNPHNPHRGISRAAVAGLTLDTDYLMKLANQNFVKNGFNLGGVLTGEEWGSDDTKEVKKSLDENYTGPSKQGKLLVLGGGKITFTPNTMTHRNMQYQENLEFSRDEIFAIVGVPPGWVSRGGTNNYATLTGEDEIAWRMTMFPLMEEPKDVLFNNYFSNLTSNLRWLQFDYNQVPPLRNPVLAGKLELAQKFAGVGYPINLINDTLDLGMPKVAWGDQAYNNGAVRPMDLISKAGDISPNPPEVNNAPTSAPVGQQSLLPEGVSQGFVGLTGGPKIELKLTRIDEVSEKRAEYWRQFNDAILVSNERRFKEEMIRYFRSQRKAAIEALGRLSRAKRDFTADEIEQILGEQKKWDEKLLKRAEPIYEQIAGDVTKGLEDEIGDLSIWKEGNPAVKKVIELRGAELVKVNETTREALKEILTQASEANATIEETAKLLNDFFDVEGEGGRGRAFKIARTETASAANSFRNEAFKAEGIERQEWVSARDGEVRESHAGIDGEVRRIGEPFSNGLFFPGDPSGPPEEVVNCRCVALPLAIEVTNE